MRHGLGRRLLAGWLLLLVAAAAGAQQGGGLGGLFGGEQEVLPVEEAFPVRVRQVAPERLVATWDTREGYYLYRDKLGFGLAGTDNAVARVELPPGKAKEDPYFGEVEVYDEPVSVSVYLQRPAEGAFTLVAEYQGCAEAGLCYPPQTVELAVGDGSSGAPGAGRAGASAAADGGAPAAVLSAGTGELTRILEQGRPLPILAAFFAAGLLLAFTACLYPMVPILSGLIAGDRERHRGGRAFFLSLVYVESTAIAYALAGVAAGLSGQAVQAHLQSPWVLGAFAAVFVAMALSMFGLYDLQLPARWQTRLAEASRHRRGGTVLGVAAMGALSALIVGACSGPALIAALAFIGATGDAWLGGLSLFVLANGMGVPLLLIGTAAGKWLPRAGHWMETVRRVFGVVFLAVALWMLERVLPGELALALWGMLLLGCGVFLGGLDHLGRDSGGLQRLRKAGGLALLIWGGVALVGAAGGGRDLWQPLGGVVAGGAAQPQAQDPAGAGFRTVKTVDDLENAIRQASATGRPVLVDVYADWCVYCVQLDEEVFGSDRVRRLLADAVLLRADVTAMDEADQRLLRRLDVFLPPAVMFFGPDGEERRDLRVVGFVGADEFMARARTGLFGEGASG